MARGAKARGKRIAFGDGRRIFWGPNAEPIFRNNPNVAAPGSERAKDIEWCDHYTGHRAYARPGKGKWIWNYKFKPTPGELFFDAKETALAKSCGSGFLLIEPNVPTHKPWTKNKQWEVKRYQAVAYLLGVAGHHVVQFSHHKDGVTLSGVEQVVTQSFRHALAWLSRASLYIGPEGGLHHASAALGIKAVVLFGGFIPPSVTGYDAHANISVGSEACGLMKTCEHCRKAMDSIGVDRVFQAAMEMLDAQAPGQSVREVQGNVRAAASRERAL